MKKIALLSLLSLFLFSGCRYYGGGVIVNGGYSYNDHVPSHAPAYGHRRNFHSYHYYPYADIYFDTGRNMYFYLNNHGQWSFSVNLPIYLHSRLDRGYVEIKMEADRPYLKHQFNKNKYRNTKYKSKYKYRKNYKSNSGYKKDRRYQDKSYQNKADRYRSNGRYKNDDRYKGKENHKDKYRSKDKYKYKYKDKYKSNSKYKNKENYKEKYKKSGNNQSDQKKDNGKKKDRKDERD